MEENYTQNQFAGLSKIKEAPLSVTSLDNPRFLWPSKEYTDSTGTTHKLQRGYMRSLLSERVTGTSMPNRRLFFQFNPQVLVRSVQQTPGAMLPILQNPNQLLQPVPGTTSFAFEMTFNREHEVNSGFNPLGGEWDFNLETGGRPLVSQIGVLADLLILDSITGQGISKDMIDSVYENARRQAQLLNEQNAAIRQQYEDAGVDIDNIELEEVVLPTKENLKEMFEANLGNSAFLNPTPFRVLFSSLFMVEGIANSVEVIFQKFTRNMVPTQCKVTINMYALYLGFAKEKTYLLDNIANNVQQNNEDRTNDIQTRAILATAITSAKAKIKRADPPVNDYKGKIDPVFEVTDIKHSEKVRKAVADKKISSPRISFRLDYEFTEGIAYQIPPQYENPGANRGQLTLIQDNSLLRSDRTNHDLLKTGAVKNMWARKAGQQNIFNDQVPSPRSDSNGDDYPVPRRFIRFVLVMQVEATNLKTNSTVSADIKFPEKWVEWHPTISTVELSYSQS